MLEYTLKERHLSIFDSVNLKEIERTAISLALKKNLGSRTHTAKELGIAVRTLYYKIKEYEIDIVSIQIAGRSADAKLRK